MPIQPGRRTGRRPGNADTRQLILDVARTAFARHGFSATSIRSIAAKAGVDPALVHHYFGSKSLLLLATVRVQVDLPATVRMLTAGGTSGLGARLAGTVLNIWESPAGDALVAVVRSAVGDPAVGRLFREFLLAEIINRVLHEIRCPPEEVGLRGALLASQMLGVFMGRYVLRLGPLVSEPVETLVAGIAPTLQRYLDGPIGGGAP